MKRAFIILIPMFLFIALVLKVGGVNTILGSNALTDFIRNVNVIFSTKKLIIPNVPQVPINNTNTSDILKALLGAVNFLVSVVNMLLVLVNFVWQLMQYTYWFIVAVVDMFHNMGVQNPIIGY